MGNRLTVVPFSRGCKGRWQFPHQPRMKGPEPGSLWWWGQGICRQRCSPSVPADEMCGGTECWSHRLTRGAHHSPGGTDILGRILAQGHSDTRVKAPATKPWAAKGQIPLGKSYWRCKFQCFIPSPSLSTSSCSPSRLLLAQVEAPTAPLRHIPLHVRPASSKAGPGHLRVPQTRCHPTLHPSGAV